MGLWSLSRRDKLIVARHEVPGNRLIVRILLVVVVVVVLVLGRFSGVVGTHPANQETAEDDDDDEGRGRMGEKLGYDRTVPPGTEPGHKE
jgi:hypothetical protein